jgi:hypothetical protein
MISTLKSMAKSLPYPLFLRLFYAWDRVDQRARAETARKRAGIPMLGHVDLLKIKSSDTLFVLGSGPSINRISAERWQLITANDTLGFNFWLYHSFVPKFYFFESIEKPASPEVFDSFLALTRRRAADYASTVKVVTEFHRLETQTMDHLPPEFRKNVFAVHKVEAPARNEAEFARALQYLQRRRAFQVTGRFSSLLKYASSLTSILVFALKLGYKRIVLCGIDLKTPDYFFQDRRIYAESWELPVAERKERHDTDLPLAWRLPATRVVAVIKQQLLDPAGVELLVENQGSALWPVVPALPTIDTGVRHLSDTPNSAAS